MLIDRYFDGFSNHFKQKIYQSPKGYLRLQVLWQEMLRSLPLNAGGRLRILEVGGGQGEISRRLAILGHSVHLTEPSAEMLAQAKQHIGGDAAGHRVTFSQAALMDLAEQTVPPYDMLVCHAVLEWLRDPWAVLPLLRHWVRPGGYLSLLFYNEDGLRMRHALWGNLRHLRSAHIGGRGVNTLTPISPLDPRRMEDELLAQGWELKARCGLRVVYDFLDPVERDQRSLDHWLAVEQTLCRQEPFWRTARYLHFTLKRRG